MPHAPITPLCMLRCSAQCGDLHRDLHPATAVIDGDCRGAFVQGVHLEQATAVAPQPAKTSSKKQ
jgi:hypothetical protein